MLRGRTLGPEHSETQTQLRKSIRTIKDRVRSLEGTLHEGKRKLASTASGKAAIRAPTLDTVNRTYRNIDAAIQQQLDEVSRLADRISTIDIDDPHNTSSPRDARLPDRTTRRPYNVTPTVASTTAAALNAEHSAHRLKKALLSVRKQPILNNKAASIPAPISVLRTPQKPTFFGVTLDADEAPPSIPEWNDFPSSDDFNPNASRELSRGAADRVTGQKRRTVAVAPKKTTVPIVPSTPSAPVSPGFDWGPLAKVPIQTTPPGQNLPRAFVPLMGFTTPTKK